MTVTATWCWREWWPVPELRDGERNFDEGTVDLPSGLYEEYVASLSRFAELADLVRTAIKEQNPDLVRTAIKEQNPNA